MDSQILRSRYKILKELGRGGFGITYLAEDIDLPDNPKCVVKHLQSNLNPQILEDAKRWFESEAQILYRLGNQSDRIPKLFAHFEDKGEFYLVQEFVDGEDLSKNEIVPGKKWSEAEVIQLLEEILEVFIFIHNKNIIHRDIKPANLMRRKKDGKIVVIDFGAVKEISTLTTNNQGETVPSMAIGTPGFMPSEQFNGQPKLCSDIYAIGMLGIYALTGIQPHNLPKDPINGETIWRNWANVSEEMADILSKMVRYHFRDRYQNASDAMSAISPKGMRFAIATLKPKQEHQVTATPRREIIKTLGWLGTGVGLSFLGSKLLPDNSNKPTPTPPPPPKPTKPSLATFNFETVTVDSKGTITNRRKLKAEYIQEDLGNEIILQMVKIPGGNFIMGSPSSEVSRSDQEGPQHEVSVPSFFMGRYEVTQAQYQEIMGNNPAHFKSRNRPVENVSWDNAVEFCKILSKKTGRNYRLPSEAEWEYACRAGTDTPFYFGETITTALANYNGEFKYGSAPKGINRKGTTEVGKFPPNAFGLYDMHGNVWEWCQDNWHSNYNNAPTNGSPWVDNNDRFIFRGGSWFHHPKRCRSAYRNNDTHAQRDSIFKTLGFRLVCDV